MLPDSESVLDKADDQLAEVRQMYEESLQQKQPSGRLLATIKNVLDNQRSALEFIAHAIYEQHGKKGSKCYYPYAHNAAEFNAVFDKNLPGVRAARPDIATAIQAHQPYQAEHGSLGYLVTLSNENKHRNLSPQSRREHRRFEVRRDGATMSMDADAYLRGDIKFNFGPGVEIRIAGHRVNSEAELRAVMQEVIYVDWLFTDTGSSVIATLESIQSTVRQTAEDVSKAAGL